MRLVDADVLIKEAECSEHDNPHTDGIARSTHRHEHRHFIAMIDDAPTIEAYTEADVISAYNEGVAYGAEQAVRHGRCPYCKGETNDFIPLNQTVKYSGIEMALNRQGMLRVRVYEPEKTTFTTQDIVEIKHCPHCGAKMDGGTE